MIIDIKMEMGGCAMCGYNEHPAALDFNHIDPATKAFNVAEGVSRGKGRKAIKAEIEKCNLLCANCHRIHTYESTM